MFQLDGKGLIEMKKLALLLPLLWIAAAFSGCSKAPGAPAEIRADRVTITYGVSSYAMFTQDETAVQKIADAFSGLQFEETDREMDVFTAMNVVFQNGDQVTARFSVDKNGVFTVGNDSAYYRLKSGSFPYEEVYGLYENSRR